MNGVVKLVLICAGVYVFFVHISPVLVRQFPLWVEYNKIQEETGIHSGMLYYSDLPIIHESEAAVRAGVAKGMELWRQSSKN